MNISSFAVCFFLVVGLTTIDGFNLWLPNWFSGVINTQRSACSDAQGVYLPIDDSCNSYNLCINGELRRFRCPKGMYLDVKAGYCKKDTQNVCQKTSTTTEAVETTTENPQICPSEFDGHFVAGNECYSFYMCTQGNAIPFECPSGQMFSKDVEYCIADKDGICRGSETTTDVVKTTEEVTETTQENSSTEEPITTTEEPTPTTEEPTSKTTAQSTIGDLVPTEYSTTEGNEISEEPSTTEESSASEEPPTTEEPSASEEPSTTEESSASEEPSTTEESSATEEPSTTEESSASEEPSTTEEPSITEEPSTPDEPSATDEPTTSDESSTTDEPTTSDESSTTDEPPTSEESSTTDEPSTSEEPSTTDEPSTSEEPQTTEEITADTSVTKEPETDATTESSSEESSISTQEPSSPTEEEPQSPTEGPATTNPETTTKNSDNVCEGVTIGAVPHDDCNKYYFCNQEIPTVQVCPEGDYFDKNSDACVEDVNGVCVQN